MRSCQKLSSASTPQFLVQKTHKMLCAQEIVGCLALTQILFNDEIVLFTTAKPNITRNFYRLSLRA